MAPISSDSRFPRRGAWVGLLVLVLIAFALVAIPIWHVRPFRGQTPEGLAVSYAFRRWAPLGTVLALLASLVLAFKLWRGGRWWSRTVLILGLGLLGGMVWFARFNVYEKMFAPLPDPRFARVAEADWMRDEDLVLAVEHGGDAVAFPVRQLAYHHIVQDVVGGVAVAATY